MNATYSSSSHLANSSVPGAGAFPWYGIRTKSNCEKVAAGALASRGYQHYLPVYNVQRRWSDRVMNTARPLFPGYVFCRFDSKKRVPVISSPGVVSIVGFGSEPAPIENSEIEAVQQLLSSGLALDACSYLKAGQRVQVKYGPLAGVEGIFVDVKSKSKLVVSVSMLQRSVAVEIDRDCVSAA